jgi:hypothetical protein
MAVCMGLAFWLEAATASLRHRCCAGLTAARAVLNGLAATGSVIAAIALLKGRLDRYGWRAERGALCMAL